MSTDDDASREVTLQVDTLTPTNADLGKAEESTQLEERRIRARSGLGIKPPYNPDRLAAFLELNETHSASVRKKARYEVGFGFVIVPHEDVDPEQADDDERKRAERFWHSPSSRWQTGPHQSAEPTTPLEVLELARQDYHAIGWGCLEILANNAGDPVGLAHVPANTVRVRRPPADEDIGDGEAELPSDVEFHQRGYVQVRQGRRRFFGEAGDRYRGGDEGDDRDPVFVDAQNGDFVTGSAEPLDNEPANELIFVRNPSPLADHYGIPDWISSLRTITADEAAKDYNRQLFDNDTIPRMVVKVTGGELTEESRRDLRQMLHGHRDESHRTAVLEVEKFQAGLDNDVEIELEPMSQGVSEEMSFEAFRDKNEHDIAKAHEVPPVKIGVTETSNRSNSKAQEREFALEVIQPEQRKFAERLYRIIHQQALDVTDWTLEYKLKGAEQPKEDAEVARRKINAVNGAIPVNRALKMVGEDPLPDDHETDGDTLVADIGGGGQPPGGQPGGEMSVDAQLPPPANKIGERDWSEVEAQLQVENGVATKDPVEQQQFDSSNLFEGLYDFGDRELVLSFRRDEGQNSVYIYVDVPASEWQGLVNAGSHGSYHWDNIRMEFGYLEVTNNHERLPEGPTPDEAPDDIPGDT
jgi:PBSX family phage portal protein